MTRREPSPFLDRRPPARWLCTLAGLLGAALLSACPSSGGGSTGSPAGTVTALDVQPGAKQTSSGEVGTSFQPASYEFVLRNSSSAYLPYSVTSNKPWLVLSHGSGRLGTTGQARLTATIEQSVAAQLAVGSYLAKIKVRDELLGQVVERQISLEVTAGGLNVTPNSLFSTSGLQAGPFSPPENLYLVTNVGTSTVDWMAAVNVPWLQVSPTSGQLLGGAQETLTVTVDQTQAASLGVGQYNGRLILGDQTHGVVQRRSVQLNVTPPAGSDLKVDPVIGLTAVGPEGGPFAPLDIDYVLTNAGPQSLAWSASVDQPWVQLTGQGGVLAPSGQVTLGVSLDTSIINALPLGAHLAKVTLRDDSVGAVFEREVTLRVNAPPSGGMAGSLTQFGVTWSFDRPYPVGQFANGDWWVVGPVSIVSITPTTQQLQGGVGHGSMVNPSPRNGQTQGYDQRMYAQYRSPGDYDPALNVALGVSSSNPLALPPGSSLVSTVSEADPNLRPQLQSAAILTVLANPAPDGSFRPPYCGSDKAIRFNVSQLDTSLLETLAVPAGATGISFGEAERMFERPWIDHVPRWIGIYSHPSQNMPDYGREIADQVGIAAMLLHLNYTLAQKQTLLIRFVQLGIDGYGVLRDGGETNWSASAGHMSGRKWPILFAGLMLGDGGMSGIGMDPNLEFGEDGQTFFVAETPPGSGVYNNGYGNYTASFLGVPDWGQSHITKPWFDDSDWFGDPYRLCCTSNAWWGQLLAAHVMGVTDLWAHPALFAYQDRYLSENRARGVTDWRLAWRPWYLVLWDTYRDDY